MSSHSKIRGESPRRLAHIEGRADWVILGYLVIFLATQRFALPIGGRIPIAVFLGPLFIAHLYLLEAIKINVLKTYLLLILGAVLLYSTISNDRSSVGAALSYGFLYIFWIFELDYNSISRIFVRKFTIIVSLVSIFAISQYIIQYIYPTPALFSYQSFIGADFLIEYNSLNSISYGSEYYKSNGFIFPEASALSQYLGRSIILLLFSGWGSAYILLATIAMFVTYSGTGLIILFLYLILFLKGALALLREKYRIVLSAALLGVFSAPFISAGVGDYFDIELFTQRISEFNSTSSSAYSRFISPVDDFTYVVNGQGIEKTLLGNGPGTVNEFRVSIGRSDFASGWLKAFYEFGLIGATFMAALVYYTFLKGTRSILMSLVLSIHYYILDGNINVPQYSMISLILGGFIPWWNLSPTRHSTTGQSELESKPHQRRAEFLS